MRAILTFGASLLPFLSATSALHPPGGQTGTTIEVLATGKHEDWPPDFWVSRKGLTIAIIKFGSTSFARVFCTEICFCHFVSPTWYLAT